MNCWGRTRNSNHSWRDRKGVRGSRSLRCPTARSMGGTDFRPMIEDNMGGVTEIEEAVQKLPPGELAKFREWFAAFDAGQWDRQFEEDVAAGKLEALAEEAPD